MRLLMLASGSDGNCMLVEHDGCSVLIDAGLSCREIRRRIELAGASMPQPSAIFLTHEHSDHVKGARVTARRLGIPVICTPGTARGTPGLRDVPCVRTLAPGGSVETGPFVVTSFLLPHDAAEPSGYVIEWDGGRLGIATDLGCWSHLVAESLSGCTGLVLEFNHDEDMLWGGRYPWPLKQRIASSNGHLSNSAAGDLLGAVRHEALEFVILAHLSQENNRPALALEAARAVPGFCGQILVADQDRAFAAPCI